MEKEQKQMEKRKREQVVKGGREKEDKLRLESNPSFCTLFDHRFFFMAFTHASIYICMYLWSKRFYLLRYYIAILKVSRTFFLSHLFKPKFESFELQTLLHGIHN